MPCSDGGYTYDNSHELAALKNRCDQLARIACAVMTALEADGREDFILLQNQEVREWWTAHKEFDRKRREAEAEKQRLAQLKKDALAKLSAEERKVLGIKAR